jgi:hypothetical protein
VSKQQGPPLLHKEHSHLSNNSERSNKKNELEKDEVEKRWKRCVQNLDLMHDTRLYDVYVFCADCIRYLFNENQSPTVAMNYLLNEI